MSTLSVSTSLAVAIDEHLQGPAYRWMQRYRDYMIMSADADAVTLFGEPMSGFTFIRSQLSPSGVRAMKTSVATKTESARLLALKQISRMATYQLSGIDIKEAIEADALLTLTKEGAEVDLTLAPSNILRVLTGIQPSPARELAQSMQPEFN